MNRFPFNGFSGKLLEIIYLHFVDVSLCLLRQKKSSKKIEKNLHISEKCSIFVDWTNH
jgi:hypothetical protein